MFRQLEFRMLSVLLLATALFIGCSGSAAGPSSVVSGKVTFVGTPVTAGTVLFMTDDGQAASAELGAGGAYSVRCTPGRFKVAVSPPAPLDPLAAPAGAPQPRPPANQPVIPKRYHDLGTSGLTVEVKAGENEFDIALTR